MRSFFFVLKRWASRFFAIEEIGSQRFAADIHVPGARRSQLFQQQQRSE